MRYWSQEYIDNTHRTSYLGEHRKPYEEPVVSLEVVFCGECWKHHTDWCPMFKTETNEMFEHTYVITDSPDNGYCHVGERKGDNKE